MLKDHSGTPVCDVSPENLANAVIKHHLHASWSVWLKTVRLAENSK